MTPEEFYEAVDGDYAEAIERFCDDALLARFLQLFVSNPSYNELSTALLAHRWDEAFQAAHAMKGMAGNMGFTALYASDSALTEALRGGKPLSDVALFRAVSKDYLLILEKSEELA